MRKLLLEELRVDSFETEAARTLSRGTVLGHASGRCPSGDTHCRTDVCDTSPDVCYSLGGTCGAAPVRGEGKNPYGPFCA